MQANSLSDGTSEFDGNDGRNVTPLYGITWQFSGVTVTPQ